jgi:AbrB family looped-hinge helix DNA binding protein
VLRHRPFLFAEGDVPGVRIPRRRPTPAAITVVISVMPLARSRVTSQGQISVPLEIRRKLGVGPGALLEWDEDGDRVIVRRAGRFTSEEVHRVLFPDGPGATRTLEELRQGISSHARSRRARR